jgi:hypothetical protein
MSTASIEMLRLHAVRQHPGAGEVMLHHGHIAIGGLGLEAGLLLLDVGELHLLVFLVSV